MRSGGQRRAILIDDGDDFGNWIRRAWPELNLVEHPERGGDFRDGPSALDFLRGADRRIDVVLLDVHFDHPAQRLWPVWDGATDPENQRLQGLAIFTQLRRHFPSLPVVFLTARSDLPPDSLERLAESGADGLNSPLTFFLDETDLNTLQIRVESALGTRDSQGEDPDFHWGLSPRMAQVRSRLGVLARGALPIVLEGETGVGKSWVAERFVHPRSGRSGPFVSVDLSTVPSDLVPAHLFGAVRGAYTGAVVDRPGLFVAADGGTLFLDEVQNLQLDVQKQLLGALQDRRVTPLGAAKPVAFDVKILVGTNQPLDVAVADGRFRQDLYMRLNPAMRIQLPPLRSRRDDLWPLAAHFCARAGRHKENQDMLTDLSEALRIPIDGLALGLEDKAAHGKPTGLPPGALTIHMPKPVWKLVETHSFPGNVRELQMLVENLVTFTLVEACEAVAHGVVLPTLQLQIEARLVAQMLGALSPRRRSAPAPQSHGSVPRLGETGFAIEPAGSLNDVAKSVERQYFRNLFLETDGDFSAMAIRLLGDANRARSVRLRFNQLGLKARVLRRHPGEPH